MYKYVYDINFQDGRWKRYTHVRWINNAEKQKVKRK